MGNGSEDIRGGFRQKALGPWREWARANPMLFLIIGVAFFLRLLLLLNGLADPGRYLNNDSSEYLKLARHLGAYGHAHSSFSDLALRRPPGYPVFLWAVGGTHRPAIAVAANGVLTAVTVTLAYVLAKRLWGMKAAVITALILAIEPNMLAHSNLVISETLFTTLVLGAIF